MAEARKWRTVVPVMLLTVIIAVVSYSRATPTLPQGRHPVTGEPKVFTYNARTGETQALPSAVYQVDLPGGSSPLFVRRLKVGETQVLMAEPGSGTPWLQASPDHKRYVCKANGSLYLLDAATLSIRVLTPDTIGAHKRQELLERVADSEAGLVWADQPLWDAGGTRVLYVSNRKGVADGSEYMEAWAVNVDTGHHELLFEHPGFYLLGLHEHELIFDDGIGIWAYDLQTGALRVLVQHGRPLGFGSGLVMTAEDYLASEQLVVTNVVSGDQYLLTAPQDKTFCRAAAAPDGVTLVAVLRDRDGNHHLACYSLGKGDTGVSRVIELPTGPVTIGDITFLDAGRLLVNTHQAVGGLAEEAGWVVEVTGG
ncbi:MAG: hypothetical protein K6U08_00285 [Firmicutes bacterium]|nr:hypothetical protein [Bacillota bacterium]